MDKWRKHSDDVVGDGGIVGVESCLICCFNISSSKSSSSSHHSRRSQSSSDLSKDLHVYFVLRHVLELPSEQLENYLRQCSRRLLGDWVTICGDCNENYVEKCEKLFGELMEVKRRFNDARLEVIEAIKRSVNINNIKPKTRSKVEEMGISIKKGLIFAGINQDARRFVAECDYGSLYFNSSVGGDLLAAGRHTDEQVKRNPKSEDISFEDEEEEETTHILENTELVNSNDENCEFKIEPTSPTTIYTDEEDFDDHFDNLKANEDASSAKSDSEDDEEWVPKTTSKPSSRQLRNRTISPKISQKENQSEICKLPNPTKFYECIICGYKVKRPNRFNHHLKRFHQDENDLEQVSCLFCSESLPSKHDLKLHISVFHSNKDMYSCKNCNDNVFRDKMAFRTHLASQHGIKDQLSFNCQFKSCGKSFYLKEELADHKNRELHNELTFKCGVCGNEHSTNRAYKQHMARWHSEKTDDNTNSEKTVEIEPISSSKLENTLPPPAPRKIEKTSNFYQCFICDWTSVRVNRFGHHMDHFHPEKNDLNEVSCLFCRKSLRNKQNLKIHIATFHSNPKEKFICKENCNKIFQDKSDFRTHLASEHGVKDELRFNCAFKRCGKSFYFKNELIEHKKLHQFLGFKCNFCGNEYETRRIYMQHMNRRHPGENDGLRFLHCKLCPGRFSSQVWLQLHMRKLHSPSTIKVPPKDKKLSKIPKLTVNDPPPPPAALKKRPLRGRQQTQSKIQPISDGHQHPIFYQCFICDLTFRRANRLSFHINHFHQDQATNDLNLKKNEKVICLFCNKLQKSKQHLKLHISLRHPSSEILNCENCFKEFNDKSDFRAHLASEHDVKDELRFHCSFENCEKSFYLKRELQNHKDEELHNELLLFKCHICGNQYRSKLLCKKHIEKWHPEVQTEIPKPVVCDLCQGQFRDEACLNNHTRNHHSSSSNLIKNADADENHGKRSKLKWKCSECDLKFRSQYSRLKHKHLAHSKTPNEPHLCPLCGHQSPDNYFLKQHIERVHERKHDVICEICGKKQSTPANLRIHKARVHKIGNLRVPCPVEGCGKMYEPRFLKQHIMSVHERQRPFQCDLCGKNFASSGRLKYHRKGVHENRESKPFKCDQCGKGFALNVYLKTHLKTHQAKRDVQPEVEDLNLDLTMN